MLSTARAYQQPPSGWFGGDGSWTDRDRLLTLAHTMYEGMLCPQCNMLMSVCRDPDAVFEVHQSICHATAEVEVKQREMQKAGGDPEPGLVLSAHPGETESLAAPNPFRKG